MAEGAASTFTPYSTVKPFVRGYPMWVGEEERDRIAAYQTYEEIYWDHPDAFRLIMRGIGDDKPILIPNGMTVVDTTAHYWLKGLTVNVTDPDKDQAASDALTAFLRRERFLSKFQIAKHSGVTRGDFILHLTGQPEELAAPGTRLSINSVDPAAYFPVFDDDDLDKRVAVNLVEQFTETDEGEEKQRIRKLRYSVELFDGRRRIFREEAIWELDGWDGPSPKPVRILIPKGPLDERITAIPVYHFKNRDWQGQPFGSSELRGHERLLAAVNQSITDEELALALNGLGVWTTNAPPPRDKDSGAEIPWVIFPGVVLQIGNQKTFQHAKGIDSVTPMLDHTRYLEEKLFEATGTSDVARGRIDVTTAESGIALAIKFMPTMAKIEERDTAGVDVLTNLFFDFKTWHTVYERQDITAAEILPKLGDKLPLNRKALLDELVVMRKERIISRRWFRLEAGKLGYVFPDDAAMEAEIVAEEKALADAIDPLGVGGRLAGEADAGGE